jgi:hypothetical protein
MILIMAKKFIISEKQEKELIRILNEEGDVQQMPVDKKMNKPYCIDPNKVLIVKKHLDKNFKKAKYSKIGPNGRPEIVDVVGMGDGLGNILKYMYKDQLKDYLLDYYQKMFSDENESSLFFDKMIDSWLKNKISIFGMLDVNHL